jgi:glutathione S-transferase
MLRLYDFQDSGNGYKVRLLAALLGLELEVVWVDILRGETRTEAFLRMNPNGRIPLLEVAPGRFLPESNAILCHLAEGTRFLPAEGFARSLVLSWLFWEQYSHEPFVATSRYILRHTPEDSPRRAELPWRLERAREALGLLDAKLAGQPFLDREEPSVADIALFAYTHRAEEAGLALGAWPHVRRWIEAIRQLPGFTPFFADGWGPERH